MLLPFSPWNARISFFISGTLKTQGPSLSQAVIRGYKEIKWTYALGFLMKMRGIWFLCEHVKESRVQAAPFTFLTQRVPWWHPYSSDLTLGVRARVIWPQHIQEQTQGYHCCHCGQCAEAWEDYWQPHTAWFSPSHWPPELRWLPFPWEPYGVSKVHRREPMNP